MIVLVAFLPKSLPKLVDVNSVKLKSRSILPITSTYSVPHCDSWIQYQSTFFLKHSLLTYSIKLDKYLTMVCCFNNCCITSKLRKKRQFNTTCNLSLTALTETTFPEMRTVVPTYFSRSLELMRGVGLLFIVDAKRHEKDAVAEKVIQPNSRLGVSAFQSFFLSQKHG